MVYLKLGDPLVDGIGGALARVLVLLAVLESEDGGDATDAEAGGDRLVLGYVDAERSNVGAVEALRELVEGLVPALAAL